MKIVIRVGTWDKCDVTNMRIMTDMTGETNMTSFTTRFRWV